LVKHGISEEIKEKIVQEGSVANIAGIPQDVKDTFRVAMDISAVDHIRAQGAFQKYVENSISKTINFPNEATIQDIEDGYILAWRLGCKGCTLYRDGSREVQVLNLNKNLDKAKSLAPGMEHMTMAAKESGVAEKVEQILSAKIVNGSNNYKTIPRERPEVMRGLTYRTRTSYGNLFVTINEDDHGPFEVFSSLGKAGGFFHAQTEAICRLISLALRSGIAITEIIDQLKGIRGPDIIFANGGTIHSLPDAIGQVLENHIKRGQTELGLKFTEERNPQVGASEMVGSAEVKESISKVGNGHTEVTSIANLGHAPACPDCGNMLMMAEGCLKCDLCGFSKCG